jgi:hypothetical protein
MLRGVPGVPVKPATLELLMMLPPPVATIAGITCLRPKNTPIRFTSTVDKPDESFTPRECAALKLAETMAVDHFAVDDRMVRGLRQHFSQGELLELMMMIGQYIGFGRMLAILQLEETACPI